MAHRDHGDDLRGASRLVVDAVHGATRVIEDMHRTIARTLDGTLPGDGLVPVDSALGRHPHPALTLAFPPPHQRIVAGADHLDLLDHPEVWTQLRTWLAAR